MASKLFYIAFIGNFIDQYSLSNLLWLTAFVGYFVGLGSLEYHYSVVRDVKFNKIFFENDSIELVRNHFGAVSSISFFSISIFLISQYIFGFSVFTDYLNNPLTICLIMLIVYFEIINTDQYRYFQVNNKRAQILSLFSRNFMPILIHLGLIYFDLITNIILSYLILTLTFSFLGTFFWGFYSGNFRGNIFIFRIPSFARLKKSRYAIGLVVFSSAYLQLDKVILINFLDNISYIKYSIFSMIGLASFVVVQVLIIQPSLRDWYGQQFIKPFRFALLAKALMIQLFCFVVILVGLNLLKASLSDSFQITFLSIIVLLGFISFSLSNVLSAYMYAAKFDMSSIKIEFFVCLISYLFLISVIFLDFLPVYFFPFVFGLSALLFRIIFVYNQNIKLKNKFS